MVVNMDTFWQFYFAIINTGFLFFLVLALGRIARALERKL